MRKHLQRRRLCRSTQEFVGRGGQDAQFIDTVHALGSRLPLAVGLVVLTTFVVLFLFTGSVVQPIRALIFGALTLAATLGG